MSHALLFKVQNGRVSHAHSREKGQMSQVNLPLFNGALHGSAATTLHRVTIHWAVSGAAKASGTCAENKGEIVDDSSEFLRMPQKEVGERSSIYFSSPVTFGHSF